MISLLRLIPLFVLLLVSQSGIATITTNNFTEHQYGVNYIALDEGIYDYDTNSNSQYCCQVHLDESTENRSFLVFASDFLATKRLPDSTIICRGGSCKADLFTNGNGVTTDAVTGKLSGISTGIGNSVADASKKIPHPKVGVTTVGDIRAAGGKVVNDHGNHANVSGITAGQAAELFKNVVKNPNR